MLKKSRIDRILKLQREKQEAKQAETDSAEKDLPADTEKRYPTEHDYSTYDSDHESPEALERWKKFKAEERKENVKNFFSMLIAAILVFLPALIILVVAFLLFIWLFFGLF